MAIKPDWTLGTLTLTAGSAAFTTTGSALKSADIQGGDTLITQSGLVLVIATITGENSGTLYMPCPPLAAGVNQPLLVRYQPDGSRLPAATRHLLNELTSGNIAAFAELVGQADMVPIFTGAGMLTLVSTEMVGGGGAGSWQATVVLLSGRDAYDGKEAGFRVMVIDNGAGRSAIYQKTSAAATDWSEPIYFTGPVGKQGIAATLKIGTVITGAAGSAAEVINTGTEQDAVLALKLPAGDIGQTGPANQLRIGTVQVGTEAAAQITGEAPSQALNLTLPIGPIGPDGKAAAIKIGTVTLAQHGTQPSITNSGNEREAVLDFIIPSGRDGTGSGDMQSRDYDPNRKGVDAFDMANMAEAENAKIMTAEERQDIANTKRDRHTHDNKQVLDNTTESFTTPLKSKLDNLPANANQTNTATVGAALAAAGGEQSIVDADSVAGVQSGTSNARRWTWGIVKAWIKGWITKADVGLGNVADKSEQQMVGSGPIADAINSASVGWATIKHIRNAQYNYEVMVVSKGAKSLVKVFNTDVTSVGIQTRITLRNAVKKFSFPAMINCDGWRAADGGAWDSSMLSRNVGLQIANGIAYQNFGVFNNPNAPLIGAKEAIVMMNDGSMKAARQSDGKTAQQWVNEGALWSAGFGPIIVENGQLRDISNASLFDDLFRTTVSARTLIGQRENGDIVIVTSEGATGVWGIAGNTMGQIMLDQGCILAVCLDGGGSTQTFWDSAYSHPSSDTQEREVCSFLALNVSSVSPYNSGPIPITTVSGINPLVAGTNAIEIRQIGSNIHMTFCISSAFTQSTWKALTANSFPERYMSYPKEVMKGAAAGDAGNPMGITIAVETGIFSGRCNIASVNSMTGTVTWPAKWAI